jgi:hypothetical protein
LNLGFIRNRRSSVFIGGLKMAFVAACPRAFAALDWAGLQGQK